MEIEVVYGFVRFLLYDININKLGLVDYII